MAERVRVRGRTGQAHAAMGTEHTDRPKGDRAAYAAWQRAVEWFDLAAKDAVSGELLLRAERSNPYR